VYVSAFGPEAAEVAGRIGDGFITMSPDAGLVEKFRSAAGRSTVAQAGFKVGWAGTEDDGVDIAHRLWANSGLPGELAQVLPSPRHFEQASTLVTKDSTRESVVCGPDVDRHRAAFAPFAEAGFDEVYVANMGPHYRDMIRAYGEEVLPALRR
jgi:G6PDH family F420-dependent oxidoreductase